MTLCSAFQQIPVVLADLPSSYHELLRAIGMPAVRREGSDWKAQSAVSRFVLYSSRTIDGQHRQQLLAQKKHHAIDIEKMTAAHSIKGLGDSFFTTNFARRQHADRLVEFVRELKLICEKIGLAWVRLADFPYPYRGAICFGSRDELAHHVELLPAIDDVPHMAVQQRYRLGLPIFSDTDSSLSGRGVNSSIPGSLLWKTNTTDFSEWWSWRKQFHWELCRRGSQYEIQTSQTSPRFVPQLEIWRGSHVATIPLNGTPVRFETDRLPLQHEMLRHPGGMISVGRTCQPIIVSPIETTGQAA